MKNSRIHNLLGAACIAIALVSCHSEVDDKAAATVAEAPAAPTTPAAVTPGTEISVSRESSRIEFVGAKVTRDHKGGFSDFSGTLSWIDGKPSSVAFEIGMDSIFTDTPKLTSHLKTADFFDVAQFPKATFTSTSITEAPAAERSNYTHLVNGTLTMKGIGKTISFPVRVSTDASGLEAKAEFTINRQDWGIAYKGMPDDLVKDDVLIKLDMKFPPAPEPPAPPATASAKE